MKLLFRYDSMNLKRKETLWADRNKKSNVSNLKFSLNKMNKFLSLDSEQANLHEVFEEPIYGEEK